MLRRSLTFVTAAAVVCGSASAADLELGGTPRSSGVILNNVAATPVQPTVSTGGGHTLSVTQDGRLWAWGKNDKGQIGDGTTENRNAPVEIVRDGARWVAVAAGLDFSLAIDSEGKLWSWGNNVVGQLGDGATSDSLFPKQVGSSQDWRSVSAGDYHALALSSSGALYSWGSNASGQLGRTPLAVNGVVPTWSAVPTAVGGAWKAVSAGGSHSLAIAASNDICWSWGANHKGQLGRNSGEVDQTPAAFSGVGVNSAAAGGDFSLVVVNGAVTAYGDNQYGQLGNGTTNSSGFYSNTNSVPVSVALNPPGSAVAVAAGKQHALALLNTEAVQAWGRNDSGQAPNPFAFGGTSAIGVSAGGKSSLVVLNGGSVASVGRNIEGQHGDGAIQVEVLPVNKFASQYRQVLVGDRHTLAIDQNFKLWAWGDNSVGQLGDGTITNSSVPVSITPDTVGATRWSKVAVSVNNSAAIDENGNLYIWGANNSGQFGNGSTAAGLSPVRVSGSWADVALGAGHVLAIKTTGQLFAWGDNMNAQLGFPKPTASQSTQLVPKQVGSATDWSKVAAGSNHSLGLRGTALWGWGQNILGQLGNGSNTDASAPVRIGASSWSTISVGGQTSAGISAGKLYVWGNNDKGQLGDGGTQPSNAPKLFKGDLNFNAAALSSTSIAALTTGGKIWVAGSNLSGRIGYGSVSATKTPVELSSPAGAASVSLGGAAGAAVVSSGSLYVWGSNRYGQLGESEADLSAHKAILPQAPTVSALATATARDGSGATSSSGNFSFAEGDSVVFEATPSGTGPFSYQWRKDGVDINGATGSSYEITSAGPLNAGIYDAVVSSAYGSNVESNPITAVTWLAPQIDTQPEAVNALTGTSAQLSVVASGTLLSFAWQKDGVAVAGALASTYAATTGGSYAVTVSNIKNGTPVSVTSGSVLVGFYETITLAAANSSTNRVGAGTLALKSLGSGSSLTLTVGLTSSPANVTYQWRKDLQNIVGATNDSYTVSASAGAAGLYDVVVSNPAMSVTSSGIALRVFSAPVFTRQPASQTVELNRAAILSVSAQGFSTPTIQWYGPNGAAISGATSPSLTVTGFTALKAGAYYAVATNESGSTTSESASLSLPGVVAGKPTILTQPQSQAVVAGGSASFAVTALDATQYQWRKNGVPIPGATGTRLDIANVSGVDVASYSVLVSNSVTSVLSTAATISLRAIVDGDARKSLFNAVYGSNGGLFAARISGDALPAATPQGYVRMNFTRAGTVSGLYTSGNNVVRFASRFALNGSNQVAEVVQIAGSSSNLLFTISADASNPVAKVQLIPSDKSQPATTAVVTLARLGVKNLTLSSVYTGTFQDLLTGAFDGYASTKVNLNSGMVAVSGMLPDGERFTASSAMYADPEGLSPASMSDFVVRLSATKRLFSTWKLETASIGGDAVVVNNGSDGTEYSVTGARYAPAALGNLLAPFVSTRDEAVVTDEGNEVSRFTAQANRLIPNASAFASSGGRFSIRFVSSTGVVSGLVTLESGQAPISFTGVILQGEYRTNGGVLGVAVTPSGKTLRFEPAN